jgi:hypothetical protein
MKEIEMKSVAQRIAVGLLMLLSVPTAADACGEDNNRGYTRYNGGYTRYNNGGYGRYTNNNGGYNSSLTNLTTAIRNLRNRNRGGYGAGTYSPPTYTQPAPVYTTQQQQMVAQYGLMPLYEWDRMKGHSLYLDKAGNRWEFDAEGRYFAMFPQYRQLKYPGSVSRRDDDDD